MITPEEDSYMTTFIVATHLTLTFVQFILLIFILVRDSEYQAKQAQHNRHMKPTSIESIPEISTFPNLTDRERYQMEVTSLSIHTDKEARDTWLRDFIYVLIVILYYLGYDIYRLTDPRTFIRPQDADNKFDPTLLIILYLGSYAIRMEDRFPTFPTFGALVFGWMEKQTDWFDVYNLKGKAYFGCFALRVFSEVFTVLISASTYIFADYDYCTNYFVCIYSWDHWFQIPIVLGWVWMCRGSSHKYLLGFFFFALSLVMGFLPFFVLPIIIPLTLLLSLIYGFVHTSVALYLLATHQTKS